MTEGGQTVALLEARSLQVRTAARVLVRCLDLELRAGERWGLLGPNGSGKTFLLETLLGLRAPAAGSLAYQGRALADWTPIAAARHRAFLPQDNAEPFDSLVREQVLSARHPWRGKAGLTAPEAADQAVVVDALAAVHMQSYADRRLSSLSGGERQRVALATVLAQQTPLLLLDEPLNHLDLANQTALLGHLQARSLAGVAVLCSLHDLNQAAAFATHVILLHPDGTATAGPVEQQLRADTLGGVFGLALDEVWHAGSRYFLPAASAGAAVLPADAGRIRR